MFRTIRPENGYCLFFPDRPKGRQYEAGRKVRVGLWEEWKHVKLGLFQVVLPEPGKESGDLFTTAENAECSIQADFKVVVGGAKEEGREDRLRKATQSCPTTRDIRIRIEFEFFRPWATNYCKTAIKRILQGCKYVELITNVDQRAKAAQDIKVSLEADLAEIGLILVESTVLIEPREPRGPLATKEILATWLEFKTTFNDAALKQLEADNLFKQQQAELNRKNEKELAEIAAHQTREKEDIKEQSRIEVLKIQADSAVKEREQARDKEQKTRDIQLLLDKWAQEAQVDRIRRDAGLNEEREKEGRKLGALKQQHEREEAVENQKLADLKHQQELKDSQTRMQQLELDQTVAERELALFESERRRAQAETDLEYERGLRRAEVMEKESLARSANSIAMQKILMEGLPKVLEGVTRPMERIGDIRVISIPGGDHGEQGHLSSLFASLSFLPLLKEVIRFVGSMDETSEVGIPPQAVVRVQVPEQAPEDD